MISYYKKNKLSKSGELRYGEDLSAPKISSLFKTSIYLSSLFLLFPSTVFAAIYLLPDVQVEEKSDILSSPPKASIDSERCEKAGYTYYASGRCPSYHNQETCVFMDKYLKCDARGWCLDNGYATTSCTSPKILNTQCPNGMSLYKYCVCTSDYKYACTGTGYSSGNGTVCDGKYTKCNCSTNYVWSGSACVCDSSFKYTCKGTGYSSGSGTSCGEKYKSCNCSAYYSWNGSSCVHNHSYSCPSGYSASNSGMISPVNTSKVCQLSGCNSTSGTCYKETHSHSYSCPSGYSTSCSYGYSSSASKTCSCGATSGTCYKCTSNSTPTCPSGYTLYPTFKNNYGPKYFNYSSSITLTSDKSEWCIPSSSIAINSSVSSLYSGDYIYQTGTYSVSGIPMISTQTSSGTLTINGNVVVDAVFLMNSSAKLVINGTAIVKQAIYLKSGAKFCPSSVDTTMVTYNSARGYTWCVKNWSGMGDSVGDGMCDFDGECYY